MASNGVWRGKRTLVFAGVERWDGRESKTVISHGRDCDVQRDTGQVGTGKTKREGRKGRSIDGLESFSKADRPRSGVKLHRPLLWCGLLWREPTWSVMLYGEYIAEPHSQDPNVIGCTSHQLDNQGPLQVHPPHSPVAHDGVLGQPPLLVDVGVGSGRAWSYGERRQTKPQIKKKLPPVCRRSLPYHDALGLVRGSMGSRGPHGSQALVGRGAPDGDMRVELVSC